MADYLKANPPEKPAPLEVPKEWGKLTAITTRATDITYGYAWVAWFEAPDGSVRGTPIRS
jgi:hypothetical protein